MSARTLDKESCHKRGVVLTCYVDGHKRFRVVPVDGDDNQASDGAGAGHKSAYGLESRSAFSGVKQAHQH